MFFFLITVDLFLPCTVTLTALSSSNCGTHQNNLNIFIKAEKIVFFCVFSFSVFSMSLTRIDRKPWYLMALSFRRRVCMKCTLKQVEEWKTGFNFNFNNPKNTNQRHWSNWTLTANQQQ
jgi:hypothetical protein